MKWTDRDLLVLILALVVASVVAGVDVLIDLAPQPHNGVITGVLVAGGLWTFYLIGKRSS